MLTEDMKLQPVWNGITLMWQNHSSMQNYTIFDQKHIFNESQHLSSLQLKIDNQRNVENIFTKWLKEDKVMSHQSLNEDMAKAIIEEVMDILKLNDKEALIWNLRQFFLQYATFLSCCSILNYSTMFILFYSFPNILHIIVLYKIFFQFLYDFI